MKITKNSIVQIVWNGIQLGKTRLVAILFKK